MKPLLQVEGVSKSFARGGIPVRVLENVSMEVHDGELFAIYGKRASGKTTLLEIAAGLADPDAGTVSFNGRDMARMSQRQLAGMHRDHVGWVEREAVTGLLREVASTAGVGVLLAVPELHPMLLADHQRILAGGKLIGPPPDYGGGKIVDFPRRRSA